MTPEDREYAEIVERLAADFGGLIAFETIVKILQGHVYAHPDQPAKFIETAVRMKLKIRRQGQDQESLQSHRSHE